MSSAADSLQARMERLAADLELEAVELQRSARAAQDPAVAEWNRREAKQNVIIADRIRRAIKEAG